LHYLQHAVRNKPRQIGHGAISQNHLRGFSVMGFQLISRGSGKLQSKQYQKYLTQTLEYYPMNTAL